MKKLYTLHSDGGARGNPGPSAIGCILADPSGGVVATISRYVGIGTNNQAEYKALIAGLEEALRHNIQQLQCLLDSELIVHQLNGVYRVKDAELKVLFVQALKLLHGFEIYSLNHIPRSKNAEADKLVNQALDEQERLSL